MAHLSSVITEYHYFLFKFFFFSLKLMKRLQVQYKEPLEIKLLTQDSLPSNTFLVFSTDKDIHPHNHKQSPKSGN